MTFPVSNPPTAIPWTAVRWALLVGVLLRIGCVLALQRIGYIYPDEESYLDIGSNILKGHGYVMSMSQFENLIRPGEPTTYWGCLTPLLSAALQAVVGGSLLRIRLIIGVVSFVATFLLALRYARIALDRTELIVLAWLLALHPNLHFLGSFLMTETLFIPLTLASLCLLQRARASGGLGSAGLTGAMFGLAHLTRPVLMPFELFVLGFHWWRSRWNPRWLLQGALCLLATTLVMTPWVVRNQHHYGAVVVETKSGFGMHLQNSAERHAWLRSGALASTNKAVEMPDMSAPNEYQRSRLCGERFWTFVQEQPRLYLDLCLWRAKDLFELNPRWMTLPQVASPAVSAVMLGFYLSALAGLVLAIRRRILPEATLLLGYIALLSIATIAAPRYRAPAEASLLMLSSISLVAVVRRLRRTPPDSTADPSP